MRVGHEHFESDDVYRLMSGTIIPAKPEGASSSAMELLPARNFIRAVDRGSHR